MHPQDVEIAITAIKQMVNKGEVRNVTYRVRNAQGEYVRLIASGNAERDDLGQVYLNIYHDDASFSDCGN